MRGWPAVLAETVAELLEGGGGAWPEVAGWVRQHGRFELVEGDASAGLAGLMKAMGERAQRRSVRGDEEAYVPLDVEDVAQWLSPGGPCARTLEGYEHRSGQVQMARAVAEAFNARRHLAVEAGTGVGKSVAYLLPSILWSLANHVPVVISTNTKNLQAQLFHKDIPMLRNVVRTPFKAALIKGRTNYLCLRKALMLLERREIEMSQEEWPVLAQTLVWMARTQTGDLDEVDRVFGREAALRSRLTSSGEECGGRACQYCARCFVQKARNAALGADVVVANHALVFAENEGANIALPTHAQVIFDEAHNIEEAATLHFTVEVSWMRFHTVLRKLWRRRSGRSAGGVLERLREWLERSASIRDKEEVERLAREMGEAILAVDDVRRAAHTYFRHLATIPHASEPPLRYTRAAAAEARWQEVAPSRHRLLEIMAGLHDKVKAIVTAMTPEHLEDAPPVLEEMIRDATAAQGTIAELRHDVEFVSNADDRNHVYWLDLEKRDNETVAVLMAAPIDIAALLAETVFATKHSVILTSATLSVNGTFNFLAHRLGIDRLEAGKLMVCRAESPFDYAQQCRVAVPLFLPDPSETHGEGGYVAALIRFLIDLLRHTRGRALILFTSYEMLRACAAALESPLREQGITLLVQGGGLSRDRLTRHFRSDVSSVLLGTDSFWEGVDVMGESLSCVVIARLPFDAVKDPVFSARSERIAEEGGNAFSQYALPNAIIKFRQGFGRLIRSRDDRGCVIIADRRIHAKNYGLHFRRNLPCSVSLAHSPADLFRDLAEFLM
ncbi:MAG: hypothetical protein FWF84_07985 [Kiritimatiellaeota bacterium]|nr:hypothetical protein [Kiritimatiellota bacterium]